MFKFLDAKKPEIIPSEWLRLENGINRGKIPYISQILFNGKSTVKCMTLLPDGSLTFAGEDKTICIWDTNTGKLLRTLHGHTDTICYMTLLPDGRLASAGYDKTIHIWNPNTGERLQTLSGHTDTICYMTLLPNGRLASGDSGGTIRIWDLDHEAVYKGLRKSVKTVNSLSL